MRPLWAIAGVALLGTAGVTGALLAASSGGEEEVVQQAETSSATPAVVEESPVPTSTESCVAVPPPGAKLWRWGDLVVSLSDGISATGDFDQNREPVLEVFPDDDVNFRTMLDAKSGGILSQPTENHAMKAAIDESLATATLCKFDEATAPWPYNGAPPQGQSIDWGSISVIQPDPASGIEIWLGGATCHGEAPTSCEAVLVQTARSTMAIDASNGQLLDPTDTIDSVDLDAFARYLESVVVKRN